MGTDVTAERCARLRTAIEEMLVLAHPNHAGGPAWHDSLVHVDDYKTPPTLLITVEYHGTRYGMTCDLAAHHCDRVAAEFFILRGLLLSIAANAVDGARARAYPPA